MKIISWNVNGIRAIVKKNFVESFERMDADILCIQETKAQDDQVIDTLSSITDRFLYTSSAIKKGYSGTAILSKKEPISIVKGIGIEEHDTEGRTLTLDYNDFYLVTVYVPNSGSGLVRLDYRKQWDRDFCDYLKNLEKTKPVIVCGDFNVAHTEIDLARPKPNYNKSAGYMQEEIDGMDRYISEGFVDTFRHFYPNELNRYSWWSYRAGARGKNVGWRLDYFLASELFIPNLEDSFILDQEMGSDHCPVGIQLK